MKNFKRYKMDLNQCLKYYYYRLSYVSDKYLYAVDRQISKNLKDGEIYTRPVQTNGLWCFTLLPVILLLYRMQQTISPVYSLMLCLSVGLVSYCGLFITFLFLSCMVLREPVPGGCMVSSLISASLIYVVMGKGIVYSLTFALCTTFSYSILLRKIIIRCPKTFTVGEAMLVAQGVVLFTVMCVASVVEGAANEERMFVNTIVYTVLLTVCLMVTCIYLLNDSKRDLQHLTHIVGGGIAFLLLVLHVALGANCLLKILNFVFLNEKRIRIFGFWFLLVILASTVLIMRTMLSAKATTVTRKTFHIFASLVFTSGILLDLYLMRLAAGIVLGALIFVEALRKSRIDPISSALESAFQVYCDEKDCGTFAMTPLYLYCGLACPLVLVPGDGFSLEQLSGVLAVGVGDTAASWFGTRYGETKWPGGTRTVEGTTFNILSQVVTVYALELFDCVSVKHALARSTVAAAVSGLVEAHTDQVDNLVLPLVTVIAFQLTWFLS